MAWTEVDGVPVWQDEGPSLIGPNMGAFSPEFLNFGQEPTLPEPDAPMALVAAPRQITRPGRGVQAIQGQMQGAIAGTTKSPEQVQQSVTDWVEGEGPAPMASDGQSFDTQDAKTQAMFRMWYGTQAKQKWRDEHEKELENLRTTGQAKPGQQVKTETPEVAKPPTATANALAQRPQFGATPTTAPTLEQRTNMDPVTQSVMSAVDDVIAQNAGTGWTLAQRADDAYQQAKEKYAAGDTQTASIYFGVAQELRNRAAAEGEEITTGVAAGAATATTPPTQAGGLQLVTVPTYAGSPLGRLANTDPVGVVRQTIFPGAPKSQTQDLDRAVLQNLVSGTPESEAYINRIAQVAWYRERMMRQPELGQEAPENAPTDYIQRWKQMWRNGENPPLAQALNQQIVNAGLKPPYMRRLEGRPAATAAPGGSLAPGGANPGASGSMPGVNPAADAALATAGQAATGALNTTIGNRIGTVAPLTGPELPPTAQFPRTPFERPSGDVPGVPGSQRLPSTRTADDGLEFTPTPGTYGSDGTTTRMSGGVAEEYAPADEPLPEYLAGAEPRSGLSAGVSRPQDQAARLWQNAKQMGGQEFADAVGGLVVAEGGLTGAVGDTQLDKRGSHGPFQFYWQGEMQKFKPWLEQRVGRPLSEQEVNAYARDIDTMSEYYLPRLYGAYQNAKRSGQYEGRMTVGLAAEPYGVAPGGHNNGIKSNPAKFYPIYEGGQQSFLRGRFSQGQTIAGLR